MGHAGRACQHRWEHVECKTELGSMRGLVERRQCRAWVSSLPLADLLLEREVPLVNGLEWEPQVIPNLN